MILERRRIEAGGRLPEFPKDPVRHDKQERRRLPADALALQRTPEPLDGRVVHPTTVAINSDPDARIRQRLGDGLAGELAFLVSVEGLAPAMPGQRILQRLGADRRVPVGVAGITAWDRFSMTPDRRHDSAWLADQSMIAPRYSKPRRIGMHVRYCR